MANQFIINGGFKSKNGDCRVDDGRTTVQKLSVDGTCDFKEGIDFRNSIIRTGVVNTTDSVTPNIDNVSVWKITTNGAGPYVANISNSLNDGQILTIVGVNITDPITLTPNTSSYTSFRLTANGDSVNLLWDSSVGWIVIGSYGTQIA